MPKMKKAISLLCSLAALTAMSVTAFADEPYEGYTYDWYGDALPSQNGYVPEYELRGVDIEGCGAFNQPNDMAVSASKKFFIADTLNNRIVILDEKLAFIKELKEFKDEDGSTTTLKNPNGVYVTENDEIYIADTANARVIACDMDGNIFAKFEKPDSSSYDKDTFEPQKVIVDKSNNVYVIVNNISKGALSYIYDNVNDEVTFKGYYGTNRVQATSTVIANKLWSYILTEEQMAKRQRSVPIEIANFDMDEDGFVYTVTSSKTQKTDVLKKLNPGGTNIFVGKGFSDYKFGDFSERYYNGQNYTSSIVDVDVGENGIINLLDFTTKRIFQYNSECDLLFIFGGEGGQIGLFTYPTAVESLGDRIYVLDKSKNNITCFKRTEFGEYVHNAVDLHLQGLYDEALVPWEEVLRRDGNYSFAYVGIGKAYLNAGEYKKAMDYFYLNSRPGYNKAFKYYRTEFIRNNFSIMVIVIAVIVIAIIVIKQIRKRRKKKAGVSDK